MARGSHVFFFGYDLGDVVFPVVGISFVGVFEDVGARTGF